jgi:hypothetical protein
MGPIPEFDEDEASRAAEDLSQATPELLEGIARGWNWDGGIDGLVKVIRHKRCDLGTAMRIYWLAGPGYYLTKPLPKKLKDLDEELGPWDTFDLIVEIERRVEAGYYKKAEIDFDPRAKRSANGRGPSFVVCLLAEEEAFLRDLPGWAYQAVGPNAPKRPPGRPQLTLEERLEIMDRAARRSITRQLMSERTSGLWAKVSGTKVPQPAPKPALSREQAIAKIVRAKWGDAGRQAQELLRLGVCLVPGGKARTANSRFGGAALLPPNVQWPRVDRRAYYAKLIKFQKECLKTQTNPTLIASGRKFLEQYQSQFKLGRVPLTLLAVINLSELSAVTTDLDLPHKGVLNIFYDMRPKFPDDATEYKDQWRVIHVTKKARTIDSPPGCDVTPAIGMKLEPIWTLPPIRLLWPDGSDREHVESYAKLWRGLRINAPANIRGHRIGGWPDLDSGETPNIETDDPTVWQPYQDGMKERQIMIQINHASAPFEEMPRAMTG